MNAKLFSTLVGLGILLGGFTTTTMANDHPASAAGDPKPGRSMPFRGKIGELDKAAKTIKVGARTFQVVEATKIMKAGKPSTIDEAAVGDEVGGAYREGDGGKLEIVSLRLGAKPGKEEAPSKEEKKKDASP